MYQLNEFKITKTFYNEVINDPDLRIGFEIEIMVKNASDLIRDDYGDLPHDFQTYNYHPTAEEYYINPSIDDNDNYSAELYTENTMIELSKLFESYLNLPKNSISLEDTNYKSWKIEIDTSIYPKKHSIEDVEDDIGVELISPVFNFKDGLQYLYKLLDMISNFKHDRISLYTTPQTGLHINLSHTNMKGFDYPKLAILAGDEHYLDQYGRKYNVYSKPLLQTVQKELQDAKTKEPTLGGMFDDKLNAALSLLRLSNWSAQKVMTDLTQLIPNNHHASIDFSRLNSKNPYIEIRFVGNKLYEKQADNINTLIIRLAGLLKIACEPQLYKNEYLKKVYQLVSKVAPKPNDVNETRKNPFPNIKLFLRPIMTPAVRGELDILEKNYITNRISYPNAIYSYWYLVRTAFDLKQANTLRIKQGLNMLKNILNINTEQAIKALNNETALIQKKILRKGDKNIMIIMLLKSFVYSSDKTQTALKSSLDNKLKSL